MVSLVWLWVAKVSLQVFISNNILMVYCISFWSVSASMWMWFEVGFWPLVFILHTFLIHLCILAWVVDGCKIGMFLSHACALGFTCIVDLYSDLCTDLLGLLFAFKLCGVFF
eukprot:gene2662-1660_t